LQEQCDSEQYFHRIVLGNVFWAGEMYPGDPEFFKGVEVVEG
jgi:hypothetical protein